MRQPDEPSWTRASDVSLALAVVRVVMGIDFLIHGLGRLPVLPTFAELVTKLFAHSILPPPLVTAWAYAIPGIEIALGLSITLGFALRGALFLTCGYMGVLISGQVLIGGYAAVLEEQMYLAIFAVLLAANRSDRHTLDARIAKRRRRHGPRH